MNCNYVVVVVGVVQGGVVVVTHGGVVVVTQGGGVVVVVAQGALKGCSCVISSVSFLWFFNSIFVFFS
jgi:hypothetical protein